MFEKSKIATRQEVAAWWEICRPDDVFSETELSLTNRFHVAVRLFSNRSQMTSKCGKNKKVAHEAQPTETRTSSENVTSRFCNHFSIIQNHHAYKMCSNYPGIKLEPALGTLEDKIEHFSSYAHVVHTPAKQVISRGRKNENVFKMSKNEKCTCKACKNNFFDCQICTFVGLLLPSSSWLLKAPYKRVYEATTAAATKTSL